MNSRDLARYIEATDGISKPCSTPNTNKVRYIGEYTEIYQFLSVQVYLQKSDSSQIKELTKALKDFFTAFDFEIEIDFPAKISSWRKRFFLRTKEPISQPEIQDRVKKIERALELQTLQSTQSEIDKNQAEAVSKLLNY